MPSVDEDEDEPPPSTGDINRHNRFGYPMGFAEAETGQYAQPQISSNICRYTSHRGACTQHCKICTRVLRAALSSTPSNQKPHIPSGVKFIHKFWYYVIDFYIVSETNYSFTRNLANVVLEKARHKKVNTRELHAHKIPE